MKNILLYILIFALFLLVGNLYWDRYSTVRKQITSVTKSVTTTSNKIIPSTAPRYSVSVVKAPYIINDGFNFEINVKNIFVTPFMTGIFFRNCKFIDNKNNEYTASIGTPIGGNGGGIQFSKALLPGESKIVEFNKIQLDSAGLERINSSGVHFQKCNYDNNGNNVCAPIEGFKFKECNVVTSTVSTNIDYPNKFPLVVNFPQ